MAPALADAASWLIDQALAQLLMSLVAGASASDPLARPRNDRKELRVWP